MATAEPRASPQAQGAGGGGAAGAGGALAAALAASMREQPPARPAAPEAVAAMESGTVDEGAEFGNRPAWSLHTLSSFAQGLETDLYDCIYDAESCDTCLRAGLTAGTPHCAAQGTSSAQSAKTASPRATPATGGPAIYI
jgi:hypothetical protein